MEVIKAKKQIINKIIFWALLLGICFGMYAYHMNHRDIVIELGVFSGSNWNVASANSFLILDAAIERFEEEHPGVKVHYYSGVQKDDYSEWLSRKILGGEEPDVFMIIDEDFNQLCSMGAVKNLDELISSDIDFDSNAFFKSTYESGKYKGSQYSLPYETVPTLMFVNKSLLDNEGIEVPDGDWTWADMYYICKKVTRDTNDDGVIDQFGIFNYNWDDAAFANGGELFSEDGTECYFTSTNITESVKYISQLEKLNQGQKVTQEEFNGGNVAFMPLTFAEYRTYKTYPYKIKRYANMTWDCITMPAGNSGDNLSEVNTLLMGISNHTKHEKLAWEFLKLLTTDEEVQMMIFKDSQGASVLREVTSSKEAEELMKVDMAQDDNIIDTGLLAEVIDNGHVEPKFKNYEQAKKLADVEVNKIIEEDKTIDSSMKILQRSVAAYLQE